MSRKYHDSYFETLGVWPHWNQGKKPPYWDELRKYIFRRDKHKCFHCHRRFLASSLICHHIIYKENNGSDNPKNLRTVCVDCHNKTHDIADSQFFGDDFIEGGEESSIDRFLTEDKGAKDLKPQSAYELEYVRDIMPFVGYYRLVRRVVKKSVLNKRQRKSNKFITINPKEIGLFKEFEPFYDELEDSEHLEGRSMGITNYLYSLEVLKSSRSKREIVGAIKYLWEILFHNYKLFDVSKLNMPRDWMPDAVAYNREDDVWLVLVVGGKNSGFSEQEIYRSLVDYAKAFTEHYSDVKVKLIAIGHWQEKYVWTQQTVEDCEILSVNVTNLGWETEKILERMVNWCINVPYPSLKPDAILDDHISRQSSVNSQIKAEGNNSEEDLGSEEKA